MLGLAYCEAHECPGCKGWLPDTTDPDADPDNRNGGHRYQASLPRRCHRCTAISKRRAAYTGDHDHALMISADLVPRRVR